MRCASMYILVCVRAHARMSLITWGGGGGGGGRRVPLKTNDKYNQTNKSTVRMKSETFNEAVRDKPS